MWRNRRIGNRYFFFFNFQELFEFHDRRTKKPLCVSMTSYLHRPLIFVHDTRDYYCDSWLGYRRGIVLHNINLSISSSQEFAEGHLHFHAVGDHYLRVGQRCVPGRSDATRHGDDQSDRCCE